MNIHERIISACTMGHYPWDEWEKKAIASGVSKELAALGRSVMREAFNHGWDHDLVRLCGWEDDGEKMIVDVLTNPSATRRLWDRLLETDGGRGEWLDGEWVSFA